MDKKKTKIFLGAYINYTNAQNINCLALARYLNKNKFKVYSLSLYNENKCNVEAKVFKCFYPVRISKIIGFLWGILYCDVIYFPKHHSTPRWILILSNILGKKLFTTIENNMCDLQKESMLNSFGDQKSLVNHFKYIPNVFDDVYHCYYYYYHFHYCFLILTNLQYLIIYYYDYFDHYNNVNKYPL